MNFSYTNYLIIRNSLFLCSSSIFSRLTQFCFLFFPSKFKHNNDNIEHVLIIMCWKLAFLSNSIFTKSWKLDFIILIYRLETKSPTAWVIWPQITQNITIINLISQLTFWTTELWIKLSQLGIHKRKMWPRNSLFKYVLKLI